MRATHHAMRTTHHAMRATHHAMRATHHAMRAMHHASGPHAMLHAMGIPRDACPLRCARRMSREHLGAAVGAAARPVERARPPGALPGPLVPCSRALLRRCNVVRSADDGGRLLVGAWLHAQPGDAAVAGACSVPRARHAVPAQQRATCGGRRRHTPLLARRRSRLAPAVEPGAAAAEHEAGGGWCGPRVWGRLRGGTGGVGGGAQRVWRRPRARRV
eukprot:105161-Chlamydomonas_euryale.AAC.1